MAQQMIDESRPYETVYGHSAHRYEQDGLKFDATKRLLADQNPPEPIVTGTTTITGLSEMPMSARTEFPQDAPPVPRLTVEDLFWQIDWKKLNKTDTVLLKREYRRLTSLPGPARRDHIIAGLRKIYTSVVRALEGEPAAAAEATPEVQEETPELETETQEETPTVPAETETSPLRSLEL